MKLAKPAFALLLVCLMASLAQAQDRQGGGRGRFGGGSQFERLTDAVKKLDLTADQKTTLEALKTEYSPKFKALKEKADGILTADQKKARDEAIKAAQAATGDNRRAAYQKVRAAVTLTDDQKKARDVVMKDTRALMTEARHQSHGDSHRRSEREAESGHAPARRSPPWWR